MNLTTDQREMLKRLLDNRSPTFGMSATPGAGGRSQRTLQALERRGLVTKLHGQWRLTAKGQVEAKVSEPG
jgi:ribosomal protein S19E (S16A)